MVALHYRHLQDVYLLSICREPRFSALTTVLIAHGTVDFSFLLIRKETVAVSQRAIYRFQFVTRRLRLPACTVSSFGIFADEVFLFISIFGRAKQIKL